MFDILLVYKLPSWSENLTPDKHWCNSIYNKISQKANALKQNLHVTMGSKVPGDGIKAPLSSM